MWRWSMLFGSPAVCGRDIPGKPVGYGIRISAPYCWLDLLLTGCLFALLPATGKAVQV